MVEQHGEGFVISDEARETLKNRSDERWPLST